MNRDAAPILTRAWLAAFRGRRAVGRRLRPAPPREELIRRHAPGRSFLDVGCMWSVDGAVAFLAEEVGATAVTGVDLMAPSQRYAQEHARRNSVMRFVAGDLHDPSVVAEAGVHDVVWCSGVLYHAPNPLLTLSRLRELTGELLILSTEALPELPGTSAGCVFYPGLDDPARRAYTPVQAARRVGITEPFDPAAGFENWWWGITPSALRGMLVASGFHVESISGDPFHVTALARPAAAVS
jgi:SAM-dependent methyltransferase